MMGQGMIKEAARMGCKDSAEAVRRSRRSRAAWLRTRYADDEVEAMAQEDGEAGLLGASRRAG